MKSKEIWTLVVEFLREAEDRLIKALADKPDPKECEKVTRDLATSLRLIIKELKKEQRQ